MGRQFHWMAMILMVLLQVLLVGTAKARDCVTGEAPSGYVTGTCATLAVGANDVCEGSAAPNGIWVSCDVELNGTVGASDVMGASSSGGADYVIYGTAANGLDFCCAFDDGGGANDIERFDIHLSSEDDSADFFDFSTSGAHEDFVLYVYGKDGNDTLYGPNDLGAQGWINGNRHADTLHAYDDDTAMMGGGNGDVLYGNGDDNVLFGEEPYSSIGGNDWIECGAGDDLAIGGGGADTIYGHGGEDTIDGEGGDDLLIGGDGTDILDGDSDDDVLDGGNGDNLLVGGTGENVMCGGLGNIEFEGGPDDDVMWVSTYATSVTGTDSGGTNKCGHVSHGSFLSSGGCGYILTSKPAACP